MTDVDPDLLEEAVGFARAAGELTLGWFNHAELDVDSKSDGTPVTHADRAAERLLRELISAAHPADSITGEEEEDHEGHSTRRWVIDPIDGTKAFTHGVATYSNLLYLEDEFGPAIGIINLPALGETVYAARGLGCFLDGTAVRVSGHDRPEGAYLCCTGFHEWTPGMFERVQAAGIELRTWGDAYGYALVASGRAEAMFDPVLAWWDVAALTVIVPEAGGTLTSWTGSPELGGSTHGQFSAVASNGRFHETLTEILRP
jgi:histidinol-phosphatase